MSVSVSALAPRLVGRASLPPVWTPEAKPRNATEAITAMHDLRSWSVLCEHLRSQAYQLAPGETLLFYTDGATEARDRSDSEYGHERLARLATGQSHLPPKELVKACRNDVSAFTSSAHLSDDLTLLHCAARSVAIGRNKGPVLLRFSRSGHRKQGDLPTLSKLSLRVSLVLSRRLDPSPGPALQSRPRSCGR